ncbi:uncharacterized protein LOC131801708 [Musca domestica]|uniref:Uncharacterized protein LOC131801708 n=1 Tax=Musca domestica TaxID=7370 RepID=A0ABM3USV5_MUSDO|nr:uncharacterized protein LOC131801708 [Musca domestica]
MGHCSNWIFVVALLYICIFTYFGIDNTVDLYKIHISVGKGNGTNVVDPDTNTNEYTPEVKSALISYHTVLLIFALAMIISSNMLMMSVIKKKHTYFLPWLVCSILDAVYDILINFFVETPKEKSSVYIASTIFVVAMWYPVYYQYKRFLYANQSPHVTEVNAVVPDHTYEGYVMKPGNKSVIVPV